MKRLSMLALVVVMGVGTGIGGLAVADGHGDSADHEHGNQRQKKMMNPEMRVEKMASKLGLTAEQKAQVRSILEDQHQKLCAVREEMRVVREQTRDEITQVLDAEQREQYQSMQSKREQKRSERGNGAKGCTFK